ncbi:MAG TPA: hypothetical protein VHS28_02520 [Chloroflexota bacterium]|nr:hypothetical protein [Chloroflexota bacterium]
MRSRNARIVVGVLLLLAVATILFVSLDFQVAQSQTNTNSTISKASIGLSSGATSQPIGTVLLYVAGDGDFRVRLEKELAPRLESVTGISGVRVLDSLPQDTTLPTLMVESKPANLTWTPVIANAGVVTRMYYASDGGMSWRNDAVLAMGRPDGGPQLRVRGDLELKDNSWGLLSRIGYQRHLAQQTAISVSNALKQQLAPKS